MLTPEQATRIRQRFESTEGWDDLCKYNPRFRDAIAALPDETLVGRCNVLLLEMFRDAKAAQAAEGKDDV